MNSPDIRQDSFPKHVYHYLEKEDLAFEDHVLGLKRKLVTLSL